ncbi:MAG: hypothetical protein LWX07_06955 [Bacteroidetes bacterium]|nr:hypothetical protein [Bacteroidota bacterium]
MKEFRNLFRLSLCLLFVVSSVQCSFKPKSNCDSIKIQLLLDEIFSRQKYCSYTTPSPDSSLLNFLKMENRLDELSEDSSNYFVYLETRNIILPNKDYYLHWNEHLRPPLSDSVKLVVTKDSLRKNRHANSIGIGFLEVNEDTSRVKIFIDYGTSNNVALDERIFTYSFDKENCVWTMLDSTNWVY